MNQQFETNISENIPNVANCCPLNISLNSVNFSEEIFIQMFMFEQHNAIISILFCRFQSFQRQVEGQGKTTIKTISDQLQGETGLSLAMFSSPGLGASVFRFVCQWVGLSFCLYVTIFYAKCTIFYKQITHTQAFIIPIAVLLLFCFFVKVTVTRLIWCYFFPNCFRPQYRKSNPNL